MAMMIGIKASAVDHRGSGIRWAKVMTRVLPYWCLNPGLYCAARGEGVGFRHWREAHEGMLMLQIVNGMTPFSVTGSRGGVIAIDIGWGRRCSSFNTAGDTEQAR